MMSVSRDLSWVVRQSPTRGLSVWPGIAHDMVAGLPECAPRERRERTAGQVEAVFFRRTLRVAWCQGLAGSRARNTDPTSWNERLLVNMLAGQDECAVSAAFGKSDPSPAASRPSPPEMVHGTSSHCLSAPQADRPASCQAFPSGLFGPAWVPHWLCQGWLPLPPL